MIKCKLAGVTFESFKRAFLYPELNRTRFKIHKEVIADLMAELSVINRDRKVSSILDDNKFEEIGLEEYLFMKWNNWTQTYGFYKFNDIFNEMCKLRL